MFVGRTDELARVERLLDAARDGRSGVLVVSGEPGVGKTALLAEAIRRAAPMSIARVEGIERETDLPFAALARLLDPMVGRVTELPAPRARSLRGALGLGPAAAGERFATFAATLSLLALAAESAPLLVTVDDAHWLDSDSLEALLFVARRLEAEGIALLIAIRDDQGAQHGLGHLPGLHLGGLDVESSARLAEGGSRLSRSVLTGLHHITAGNPLAMHETASLLTPEQRDGRTPLHDPIPIGELVSAAWLPRIADLPARTSTALVLAAAAGDSPLSLTMVAAASIGLDVTDYIAAEEIGLVAIRHDRLTFAHPLLRSVIYDAATPPERRSVHAALATASRGRDPGRYAWHIAEATIGMDGEAAETLQIAAQDAYERGAYVSASRAFERSAQLSPDSVARDHRLLAAVDASILAGRQPHAAALLDTIDGDVVDAMLAADIELLRARVVAWRDPAGVSHRLARRAESISASASERAAMMFAFASQLRSLYGELELGRELGQRALQLAEQSSGPAEAVALGALGHVCVLLGRSDEGSAFVERCLALPAAQFEAARPLYVESTLALALEHVERFGDAERILDGMEGTARERGDPDALFVALVVRADIAVRTGRWSSAYADAWEAMRLVEEGDPPILPAHASVVLARLAGARGDETACRRHAAEALTSEVGSDVLEAYAHAALGLLEVGMQRPEAAVAHLEQVTLLATRMGLGEPSAIPSAADLIEGYVRLGRAEPAETALAELEAGASRTGRSWALAAAARCRGLLAPPNGFDTHFETALKLHARSRAPFETARTRLAYGERLRKRRRRSEAREHLMVALGVFELLGAEPWAERTRAELSRSGARPADRRPPPLAGLTPQEARVATVAAHGATNIEVAASLFLSPKTVDFHLGNVYRKLGIGSRTELARLVALESGASGGFSGDS